MSRRLPAEDIHHTLAWTSDVWPEFKGARIFVTGGTGFVGKWLLETFLAANDTLGLGASLVLLSRDPDRFRAEHGHLAASPALSLVQGDVRSFAASPGEFSHAIHAATDVATAAGPLETFDVTVEGTRRVLDLCANAKVRRLLLVSSGAIYGKQPPEILHVEETWTGAPSCTEASSAYGEGKRASEWMACAHAAANGYEVSVARLFAFVGPHLPIDKHFAIGNFMRDVLNGAPITVAGDGSPVRSYLHAADLSIWLWTMLARAPSGEAFNVGSDEGVTIGELAHRVTEVSGSDQAVRILTPRNPDVPALRYVPDIRRARERLGLYVRISLSDAIARTLRWHQHNR